jgi:hypothetical protein
LGKKEFRKKGRRKKGRKGSKRTKGSVKFWRMNKGQYIYTFLLSSIVPFLLPPSSRSSFF